MGCIEFFSPSNKGTLVVKTFHQKNAEKNTQATSIVTDDTASFSPKTFIINKLLLWITLAQTNLKPYLNPIYKRLLRLTI
jgi:hypothetical protein